MIIINNRKQRRHRRQLMIRRLPLQKLNNRTPKTPNITCRRRPRQLNNLRRHPIRRPHNLRLLIPGGSKGTRRYPKIRKFDLPVLCSEDVGPFDVPVDHSLVVQVEETLQDLRHVDADEVFGKFAEVFAY